MWDMEAYLVKAVLVTTVDNERTSLKVRLLFVPGVGTIVGNFG